MDKLFWDDENVSFEDTHSLLLHKRLPTKGSWRVSCLSWSSIISVFNGIALLLNVILFVLLYSYRPIHLEDTVRLRTHDFTRDAIKMETRPFDDVFSGHEGPFRGDPRPELDDAWRGLLHGYNTRVPPSVWVPAATPNHTLVELTDGSGDHYAVPAVLHELHCLKTLREYLVPDYYPGTYEMFKPDPGEMIGVHIDHCIDVLRQSSMCHADMSLLPLEWWEETDVPQNVIHTPHLCANWDQLSTWAAEHSFTPFGSGLIQRPGSSTSL